MQLSTHTLVLKMGTKIKLGHCILSVETVNQLWRHGIEGKTDKQNFGSTATFARYRGEHCYFCKVVVIGHHRGKADVFNSPELPSL